MRTVLMSGIHPLQMEEVTSIGSLPCLERVALLNNPLTIIPDYRTKVLAQFGDRASEVSPGKVLSVLVDLDRYLFLYPCLLQKGLSPLSCGVWDWQTLPAPPLPTSTELLQARRAPWSRYRRGPWVCKEGIACERHH